MKIKVEYTIDIPNEDYKCAYKMQQKDKQVGKEIVKGDKISKSGFREIIKGTAQEFGTDEVYLMISEAKEEMNKKG